MYEEGHSGFAFKNIILRLLFIVIVVILIIWLFPTKNYVKNIINQKLGTSSNQVFSTNINAMKDAALSYFTESRLPSKEGNSKTITLKEMIDKKLLVDFKDSNGKKCDYENSYATVTKNKSDYSLKVNLACKDKSDYINSYIDACTGDVCSKKKLTENNKSSESTKTEDNNEKKKIASSDDSNKECQYVKKGTGYWTNYGAWSGWTSSKITSSNSRQVETKTQKVQTGSTVEQEGTYKHTQNPKKVTITNNGVQSTIYVCPADFDNGGSYNTFVTCVKTMPNYVNKPTYRNVTYYRYRDRKYISDSNVYKWSTCNDTILTNEGYQLTGETR